MSQTPQDFTKKTIVDLDSKGFKDKFTTDVHQIYWSKRQRKIWVASLFLGSVILYVTRVAGPVTVVAMGQDLGWDKTVAGSVLSIFFWGYSFTQILGGWLSDTYSSQSVLVYSCFAWLILTFITPIIVNPEYAVFMTPTSALLLLRFLFGALQGVYFPAAYSLIGKRIAPKDKSLCTSIVASGISVGSVLSGIFGSLVMSYVNWHMVYYIFGGAGFLWFLSLKYYALPNDIRESKEVSKLREERPPVPWRTIFSKPAIWAIVVAAFCLGTCFDMLFAWMPTYFHDNYPDSQGVIFNVVPWMGHPLIAVMSGHCADHMIRSGYTNTFVRKLFQSFALLGPAIALLLMNYLKTFWNAIFLMTVAVSFCAFNASGATVNVQEVTPTYVGFVFGVMNTMGSIPGFIGVYITGYILETTGDWALVFQVTALISMIGWVVYVVFGSSKRQV
ncbi:solute carrier family 17 member 9-like [Dendronephthya gigantea]|uniref:solute carrier family 17 member 9-like n=1 Tax=Dendronephthya gigantea TaxID=151771 RepID=UPI00106C5524|nr:solute carrier family 17 member 9-like [Dendronephthya gigantea]